VASIPPIPQRVAAIFQSHSFRAKIRFIARCLTTTSRTANSNPKRRWLSRGSNKNQRGGSQPGSSVCKDRWIAIRKGNKTCYAQWEDCGPFRTDHFQYVFGNERPKPNLNRGAGLDVSPAVRDYLGLGPTDVTDWQFVEVGDVPPGPWRSYGDNNHFVIARRQTEQRVVQQASENAKK
jgi:hypothetical protein